MTEEMRELRNLIQDNIDAFNVKHEKASLDSRERGMYDAYDDVLRAIDGDTIHIKHHKKRIEFTTP